MHYPKHGVDVFMSLHDGEYEHLLNTSHYQMILQKTSGMRIGFLEEWKAEQGVQDALGYGIHVVLAFDAEYPMPAAVAIRSALDSTPGRVCMS